MKKVRKIVLLVLCVIIIFIIAIKLYRFSVLTKISNASKEFNNYSGNYYITLTETDNLTGMEQKRFKEFYRENGISVYRESECYGEEKKIKAISWRGIEEEFCSSYFVNFNDDETKELCCETNNEDRLKEDEFNNSSNIVEFYTLERIDFETEGILGNIKNKIRETLFYPVVLSENYKGRDCYLFDPFGTGHRKMYVDKETLLTVAVYYFNEDNDDYVLKKEFEYLDKAPDGVFEKPNPEEFDIVQFNDSAWSPGTVSSKLIAEASITGTNLEPGEQLVENVELKENEELNFLKLTPNEMGITYFDIHFLETYNKFKEKYSALRELTQKDFESYFVVIAYKQGEKLNYLQQFSSSESWTWNFVVNSEKSNKDSLLLMVVPKESGNKGEVFVDSDEKIKIDAEKAISVTEENRSEIEKYYGVEFQPFLGYKADHLELLTKEKFAEMDYIETPLAGQERICWNINYNVHNEEVHHINVFVDAITGDIIGGKKTNN